jgi:hypothetical protein
MFRGNDPSGLLVKFSFPEILELLSLKVSEAIHHVPQIPWHKNSKVSFPSTVYEQHFPLLQVYVSIFFGERKFMTKLEEICWLN